MTFREGVISAALAAVIFAAALAGNHLAEAASLYKSYVVQKDGDTEVLCDPYIVQPHDSVLKLFRQKGEIAEKDFPEFLNIFRRINSHVPNVDRILPGQQVYIPLKKLQKDSMPGQSSGTVVLPLVTISSFREKIDSRSFEYIIQPGDSLSALISSRFGARGTEAFNQGMQVIKLLNPEISELNRIYPGQRIRVPDPSVRNESWFAPLFDPTGKLLLAGPPELPPPAAEKEAIPETSFGISASLLNAKLLNRGVYHFPKRSAPDLEIDLSRIPVLALADGTRILLPSDRSISESDLEAIRKYWKKLKIVPASADIPLEELLDRVLHPESTGRERRRIAFKDQGIEIEVTSRWILDRPAEPGKKESRVCMTLIGAPEERTPDSICAYLEKHDILVKEILPSFKQVDRPSEKRHIIIEKPDVFSRRNPRELVQKLARDLGLYFSENVRVTFPYAGVQVEAFSNLLSTRGGNRLLIDFGELYGEAASAIEKTGIRIIQVNPEKDAFSWARDVLAALGLFYSERPTFLTARRPALYNTAITFPGILIQDETMRPRVLLTGASLPEEIALFIREQGVRIIRVSLSPKAEAKS